MNKYYCDICEKETEARLLNTIFYSGNCIAKDVCDSCEQKYYSEKEKLDDQIDKIVKPFIARWSPKK